MTISPHWRLTLCWALLSALLGWLMFAGASAKLRQSLGGHVEQHLLLTLDESHFSSSDNRISDEAALLRLAQRINASLAGLVEARWFSPQQHCAVAITAIDGLVVTELAGTDTLRLVLPRNQVERTVEVGVSCDRNWLPPALASLALGLMFLGLHQGLPRPLSRSHRYWINYLLGRGYSEAEAFATVSGLSAGMLSLSPLQRDCLERLHDDASHNFSAALAVAADPRVAALAPGQLDWLLLGLSREEGDLQAALAIARAAEEVVVDLVSLRLTVRGLEVPMGTTPLFYYAWYAQRRLEGDGWVRNPASNRPDVQAGRELAALMSAHGGHARAINDLEQAGLKARTLDQNRSKIKEDMVAALGEMLGGHYLFEAEKDPDGLHMQYRIRPESEAVRLILQS